MKKLVIFTAVYGKPDILKIPAIKLSDDIDMFCYTDMQYTEKSPYKFIYRNLNHLTPRTRNRKIKIQIPDFIFDNYEYSLYLDSNISLLIDPLKFIDMFEKHSDILLALHPLRDCLYDEGIICIKRFSDMKEKRKEQVKKYKSEGYPRNNGLYRCTFLGRRHTKEMKTFCNNWWQEIKTYAPRDQISFPYLIKKHNIKPSLFSEEKQWHVPYFKWHNHQRKESGFIPGKFENAI